MGVIDIFFVFGYVFLALVLHVEAGAEAEDDHFVASLGTLIDGTPHGGGVGGGEMEEDGVLGCPGS